MRVLTEIGEIGVRADDREIILRPSLYAMTQIGAPAEVIRTYKAVMSCEVGLYPLSDALAVIYACADEDVSEIFGWYADRKDGKGIVFVPGATAIDHTVAIAQCLLKHGVTGALPDLPRRADAEPTYVDEFDARAHVALAMAHLGTSRDEAWDMTMTELVGALRAKFPQSDAPGSHSPTKDEYEATMEWFDQVEAARALRQGNH